MRLNSRLHLSLAFLTLAAVLALAGCGGGGGGGGGGGFTVTGTTPANGAAVDPATLTALTVSFSAPLDTTFYTGTPPVTFIETKDGIDTDLTWLFDQEGVWSDDYKTVSLDVSGYLFMEGATYTTTFLAGGLRSTDGDLLAQDYVTTFTTTATAPFVTGTSPANGETGVATGTFIVINFSEPMDTTSLQKNGTITPMPGSVTAYWSSADSILSLDCGTLATDTTYILSLLTGVKDARGTNLASPVTLAFSTGAALASGGVRGKVASDPASAFDDDLSTGVAVLFDAPPDGNEPILFQPLAASGAYSIHYLEAGTYYVGAAVDSNGDGQINPEMGDSFGFYPDITSSYPVSVGSSVAYYPTITLIDTEAISGRLSFANGPYEVVSGYSPVLYAYTGTIAELSPMWLTNDPEIIGTSLLYEITEYSTAGTCWDYILNPSWDTELSVEGTWANRDVTPTGLDHIPAGEYSLLGMVTGASDVYLGFASAAASIAGTGDDATGANITLYRATIAYGQAQLIGSFTEQAFYSSATATLWKWPLTKVISSGNHNFGYGTEYCIAEYQGAPVNKEVAWHAVPEPSLSSTYLGYNSGYKTIEYGTWQEPDDLSLVSRSFVSTLAALPGGPGSAVFSKAFVAGGLYEMDAPVTGVTISISTGGTVYYLVPGATPDDPPTFSTTGGTRDVGDGPQFFIFNVTPPASGTAVLTATKGLESGTQNIPLSAGDLTFADFDKGTK